VDELLLDWTIGGVTISAYRHTVDSAQVAQGCLEFEVMSELTWEMEPVFP
jgi:hypothetical protein